MKRFSDKLGLLAGALFLLGGGSVAAFPEEAENRIATSTAPAILKIRSAEASLEEIAASSKRGYVEIEVVGYEPAGEGPVQIVVQLASKAGMAAEDMEIGRFSIFPNAPFNSAAAGNSQFFGFGLPDGFATSADRGDLRVRVSIEAEHAAINGARAEIGDVRLTTR